MMEMIRTKKKWRGNDNSIRSRSKERVSLLGEKSRKNNRRGKNTTNLRDREKQRRTTAKARPSSGYNDNSAEERVSFLTDSDNGNRRNSKYNNKKNNIPPWTLSRLMKYVAILLVSAFISFILLRKQSKMIHWEEYHNILEPDEGKEPRCFEESRSSRDERCSCPDPNKALANETAKVWKSNHDHMIYQAKNVPTELDVVFFGDGMIEQLSGTRGLGVQTVDGMEDYFEKKFTNKHGGKINAIALGSSGDTVSFGTRERAVFANYCWVLF